MMPYLRYFQQCKREGREILVPRAVAPSSFPQVPLREVLEQMQPADKEVPPLRAVDKTWEAILASSLNVPSY